ncbi:MAG TPA: BON domain-containing protein [Ramlibacter sp.]|uniref:BON domain-containing protein n=1 Tax=Ramlibacter sp. TaxID=1917967 RepID=UPI002B7669D6|nr:BON domain-containing protein [Ramlibacter sp.]HVZ42227.1 BON domain-containing protein [Ramlibacter sp.]
MKTDLRLKADVTAELAWDPAVNPARIGISVKDGVVTLSGQVDSYLGKLAAERAVRRIAGVRGIALDLDVDLLPHCARDDTAVAQAAVSALEWHALVPHEAIQVEVENGRVTLTGAVANAAEFAAAEQCVRPLSGVKDVVNRIEIRPATLTADVARQIENAFARQALLEARRVVVEVEGGVATLSGRVDSMAQRKAAIASASAAPGVTQVVDRLEVVS